MPVNTCAPPRNGRAMRPRSKRIRRSQRAFGQRVRAARPDSRHLGAGTGVAARAHRHPGSAGRPGHHRDASAEGIEILGNQRVTLQAAGRQRASRWTALTSYSRPGLFSVKGATHNFVGSWRDAVTCSPCPAPSRRPADRQRGTGTQGRRDGVCRQEGGFWIDGGFWWCRRCWGCRRWDCRAGRHHAQRLGGTGL